jgi:hypothetical protein
MPALPLFLLVATVALIAFAFWLIARAPEGIETEEGFQVVNAEGEPTETSELELGLRARE